MTSSRQTPIDQLEEPAAAKDRTSERTQQLRYKRAAAAASESQAPTRKMSAAICWAHSRRSSATSGAAPGRRRLLAGALLCTVGALLLGPQLQPNNFQSVESLKALKALAKTFVYQQLTQRKNFVPLPVPIPVPIEINEPPVYLKGKPKYVKVYKPKPTAAPVAKPTTVYHMPIYSPTYEYMSMDPMSSMYGHVAPVVYSSSSPYGKSSFNGAGYKSAGSSGSASNSDAEPDASGYANAAAAAASFSDYDDDSSHYYLSRSGRRPSKMLAATAGDYISGASLYMNQRKDEPSKYEDAVAGAASSQHQADLATSSSSNSESVAAPATSGNAASAAESEENDEDDEQRDSANAGSSSLPSPTLNENSKSSPNDDESYDHEHDSSVENHRGALRRSKRQISYQSGYNGKDNCEGLPLEVNVRSRIKLDSIFPIHGKSQMRKCVKLPLKPIHILPPPEDHY